MAHDVRQWPSSVYPGEVDAECPEARELIDVLIRRMREEGPSPDGYRVKPLGAAMGGLWQINLKKRGRQIRVLYAPYGQIIVLFRIHRKGSPQEQTRAYDLAKTRKRQFELARQADYAPGYRTIH
jgi:hypothetical protein